MNLRFKRTCRRSSTYLDLTFVDTIFILYLMLITIPKIVIMKLIHLSLLLEMQILMWPFLSVMPCTISDTGLILATCISFFKSSPLYLWGIYLLHCWLFSYLLSLVYFIRRSPLILQQPLSVVEGFSEDSFSLV